MFTKIEIYYTFDFLASLQCQQLLDGLSKVKSNVKIKTEKVAYKWRRTIRLAYKNRWP